MKSFEFLCIRGNDLSCAPGWLGSGLPTMNSNPLRWVPCLSLVAWSVAAAVAADPSPLRVSDDGRGLVDAAGLPVFVLADTAWALPARTTREVAAHYLEVRRAQRFNAVTFVLFVTGRNEIVSGLANAYGHEPFARDGELPDPTRPLVTPGSDPADPRAYDYWDHVDYLVQLTRRLGLYAIILPTWGTGVAGSYDGKTRDGVVFDGASARSYGRWVAARYRNEPHVLWMMGGDRPAVQGETDYRPVFRAMAAGVAEGAPGQLISYHSRKGAPQSGDFFHADPWLAFNSVQDWPERQIARMSADWVRTPPKPTWLFEGRYEGFWRGNAKPGEWGEWQVRQQAYQTVFAGAFGHTYGHERVFGFGNDGVDWKAHLDSPGARSMTHLATLLSGFQPDTHRDRQPDQSLIEGDAGKAERTVSDRITAARLANGRVALVYSAAGRPLRLKLDALPPGVKFAGWFNPRTGRWHVNGVETAARTFFARDLASGPGAGGREFVPPTSGPGQDWVLVVSAGERI